MSKFLRTKRSRARVLIISRHSSYPCCKASAAHSPRSAEEALLHHDGCHHRRMDIAVVTISSCLSEGKAEGASRRQRPIIDRAFVSSDRMGDRIIVRPAYLRTDLHRERRWNEGNVRDRHAVASAGRGRSRRIGGSSRGSGGRSAGGSSRRRGGRSTGGSSGGRAATGSQEYHEA